jgi:hypothetical protein
MEKDGGARRDRTADLVIANDALSQLSYGPAKCNGNAAVASISKRVAPFRTRGLACQGYWL